MTDHESSPEELDLNSGFVVEGTEFVGEEGLLLVEELLIVIEDLRAEGIHPPLGIFNTPNQVLTFFCQATHRDEQDLDLYLETKGLSSLRSFREKTR